MKKKFGISEISRPAALAILLAVFAVVLIGRIFALQTFEYQKYQTKIIDQMTTESVVTAKRGTIYDCNGKILATNRTAYRLFISPSGIATAQKDIKDGGQSRIELIATGLDEILGGGYHDKIVTNYENFKTRLDRTIEKNIIDDAIIDKIIAFISENKLSTEVYLEAGSIRYYPYGTLACHVIGFCSADGVGLYGLECQYNEVLSGVNGKTVTARDAYGNEMQYDYESYVAAIDGCDLYTTIDVEVQKALDEECRQSLVNTGSQNGTCGIVMDPYTGGILAMSTAPAFDLNSPWKLVDYYQKQLDEYAEKNKLSNVDDEYIEKQSELRTIMWKNKAITEPFIPGSTFKIITSAMALETNVVTDVYAIDSRCYCDGSGNLGSITVGGATIHCHSKHNSQSFAEGLMNSCNVTFINIGLDIGRERFYEGWAKFGYLAETGIDLPEEEFYSVNLHPLAGLNIVELATSAFGQNFKVTAIQHTAAVNAVVNGGTLYQPFVVNRITDRNGNETYSHGVVKVRRVASESTCSTLHDILEECVSGGYGGKNCYVAGYSVAAKTGTSEKVGDNKDLRIGSVMSFAPAQKPVATAFFMCDEPDPEYGSTYGSTVAAPYMQGLMEQILPAMGVEATYTEAEKEKINVKVPDFVGWSVSYVENHMKEYGFNYEIIGDGNIIRAQMPEEGTYVLKKDAKIILYTAKSLEYDNVVPVPNVIGMTATAATATLINKGFNVAVVADKEYYKHSSTAVVTDQSWSKGTKLVRGSVIMLYFGDKVED